jgi:uncharacterized protein (TIGR02453 family)
LLGAASPGIVIAMAFSGFADPACKFWKQLARNQSRDWFKASEDRYEREWAAPFLELLTDVAVGIDSAYPYCELEPPKIFRIHRDVRFSKDKSPYKTHIGGVLSVEGSGGVMDKPVALYLQVGTECFAAAGHYMIPPEKLARVRRAIVDPTRGKELASITRSLARRGFTLDGAEKLARVPRGFDPEHPLAELLRMKGLVAMFPPLPDLGDASLVRWLRKQCVAASELVTWTTYAGA